MKVCIVGAGAIGGALGVTLAQNGCEVSVLARGDSRQSMKAHGLRLARGDTFSTVTVNVSADAAALGPHDLVIVAVKAPSLAALAKELPALLGPNTTLLTAMNGIPWWFLAGGFGGALTGQRLESVDPDGFLENIHPPEKIIGAVIHGSFSSDSPGVSRAHGESELIVGRACGGKSEALKELLGVLDGNVFRVSQTSQIQKDIWFKVWGNMTVNPISALTGATLLPIMNDGLAVDFISRIMTEAKEIGAHLGIELTESPQQRVAKMKNLGDIRTSMLQDVERRRPLEIDAILASVREIGVMANLKTPYTDALLSLVRLRAKTLGLY